MTRVRDQQRSRVYKAERVLCYYDRKFETIHETRTYVKKLTTSAWFNRRRLDREEVQVADGRGTRKAFAYGNHTINLPRWARREKMILHELAHILLSSNLSLEAAHGREFCRAMLALVKHQMGIDAYNELKAAYKKHRVKYIRTKKTQQAY